MKIESKTDVTVELAGTMFSGTRVLMLLAPFAEAKRCFDGKLGVPESKMPFSVFNQLLVDDGHIEKRKQETTGEVWYVLTNPEEMVALTKDIRERLEAAERMEAKIQEVPMGTATLQIITKARVETRISNGKWDVSYDILKKVIALCKQNSIIPEWLMPIDLDVFTLLTDMHILKRYKKKDTSHHFYRVVDMEQLLALEKTLQWMDLPT